jgi:CRISPR/Cas system-associated endonuclease Cas1
MEPFRPLVAASVVVRVINNGEIGPSDFIERMGAVNLKPGARKRFLEAFEARLGHEITHPVFGYRADYRRIFEIEARLLARLQHSAVAQAYGRVARKAAARLALAAGGAAAASPRITIEDDE